MYGRESPKMSVICVGERLYFSHFTQIGEWDLYIYIHSYRIHTRFWRCVTPFIDKLARSVLDVFPSPSIGAMPLRTGAFLWLSLEVDMPV